MKRLTHIFQRTAICTVLLFCAIACESWPPGNQKFIAEFSRNRDHFDELLNEFKVSGLEVLEHGGASGGVTIVDTTNISRHELNNDKGKRLQLLLEKAVVYRVSRVGGDIVFSRPVGPEIGGRIVRVDFVYGEGPKRLSSCDEFTKSDSNVECQYNIDGNWFLLYFWATEH